jgi:hypothetical protein
VKLKKQCTARDDRFASAPAHCFEWHNEALKKFPGKLYASRKLRIHEDDPGGI